MNKKIITYLTIMVLLLGTAGYYSSTVKSGTQNNATTLNEVLDDIPDKETINHTDSYVVLTKENGVCVPLMSMV